MKALSSVVALLSVITLTGSIVALAAAAQPTAAPSAQDMAAYEAAFQDSLSKPADPPTLVKFASAAVKIGDLESAISALERLLLIDGGNPEVQLELGVLYFRLGSFEAAKSYFEAARTSRRASAETKLGAESFLKEASQP